MWLFDILNILYRSGELEVLGSVPGLDIPKLKKNDTSCSSLGTQTYRVELGLVNPVSE